MSTRVGAAPRWAAARAAVAAPLVASVLGAALPPMAAAATVGAPRDGVGAASAAVHRVEARLHRLSHRVADAERRYAAALDDVAAGVNRAISADRDRTTVRSMLAASNRRLEQQVLSLYASGGDFAAASSLLTPAGVEAFDQNSQAVSAVIFQTEATARSQQSAAAAASTRAVSSRHRATRSIATERSVAAAAATVRRLLAREQSLLAAAKARLAHEQARQQAHEQAMAAAAAAAAAALQAQTAAFDGVTTAGVNAVGVLPPPATYLALYRKAAVTCPGLPWTVLASIGQVESGHGRNDGPSSAGAMGPMQFEPATFASYAVDGDHDGTADIMDPADAIYTAARYLCANGAGRDGQALANAVFNYNHAQWYVDLVLGLAQKYAVTYPA